MRAMDREPTAKPYCNPCQTDDVTVTAVHNEAIGSGMWGADGQRVTVPVTYFDCNVCGREQSVVG